MNFEQEDEERDRLVGLKKKRAQKDATDTTILYAGYSSKVIVATSNTSDTEKTSEIIY